MREQIQDLLAVPAIRSVAIIVVSVLGAYLVEVLIRRTLMVMARKTKTDLDDKIIEALRKPIFLSVIFFGLAWAAAAVVPQPTSRWVVFAILKTLAVFFWAQAGIRIGLAVINTISARAEKSSIVQPRTLPLFDILVKVTVIGLAVYFTFLAWRIDLTAWLASAGIIGIAIGFAAKDTLANLFSGIFILADAPYKIGDFIVLDGELRGQVTAIGMRSTRILTRDDVQITVPNAVIGNSKIVNETAGPHIKRRIRVTVEAAYGSDIDEVRKVLATCAEKVPHVADNPAPVVRFRSFGASGLVFQLLVWIEEPVLRGRVKDQLNTRIYKAFTTHGLEIPYSKHDIYIKEAAPPA